MDKKEYRKRKVANDYRRNLEKIHQVKISVSQAYKENEVIEIIASVLGPLSPINRSKVFRMLQIAIEPEPKANK